jgi:hypothetical protein
MKIEFLYHGGAVGATGFLTLPVKENMDIQASVALPITGGQGSSRVENCRHRNYFSFRTAESHVVGSHSDNDHGYGTLATTTIEGLNIMDVVTCDRIVARLTAKYPENKSEPSFIPLGSRFENLRIAGHPINVKLATDIFATNPSWGELTKAYAAPPPKEKVAATKSVKEDLDLLSPDLAKNGFPKPGATLFCTLARDLDVPAGLSRKEHGIYVPHFGTVFLAEYYASATAHRLLMLRVVLGCSVEGSYGAGGCDTNGGWPP